MTSKCYMSVPLSPHRFLNSVQFMKTLEKIVKNLWIESFKILWNCTQTDRNEDCINLLLRNGVSTHTRQMTEYVRFVYINIHNRAGQCDEEETRVPQTSTLYGIHRAEH